MTITGANDTSVISGDISGSVTEGNVDDAPVTATGNLSISDADNGQTPVFADQGSTLGGNNYGSFVLTSGAWTYTLNQSAVQQLADGETVTDTITYTASDNNSQVVTVTITGANDASDISGDFSGSVIEGNVDDAPVTATGNLSISDADNGQTPVFADQGSTLGGNSYGSFVLTSGAWTYTLNQSAVQQLANGETVTDTITYTASDNNSQVVTVTITGSNDVPAIQAGDVTGTIQEGGTLSENGSITFTDVDLTDRPTATEATASVTSPDITLTAAQQASIENAFTITSPSDNTNNGTVNWDYTIADSDLDFLGADETITAVFTITVTDDEGATATQDVTITFTGADDGSVVSGQLIGDVIEGNIGGDAVTVSGTLTISDVDSSDNPVFNDIVVRGEYNYGTFELVSGVWTYTLDHDVTQELNHNEFVLDRFQFTATDGTKQVALVSIFGSDDAAVVEGIHTGTVKEGNTGDPAEIATGTLSISDIDQDDNPVFLPSESTAGEKGYGHFSLVGEAWSYVLNQDSVQHLEEGEQVTDHVTYTATDGTNKTITVNILGTSIASVPVPPKEITNINGNKSQNVPEPGIPHPIDTHSETYFDTGSSDVGVGLGNPASRLMTQNDLITRRGLVTHANSVQSVFNHQEAINVRYNSHLLTRTDISGVYFGEEAHNHTESIEEIDLIHSSDGEESHETIDFNFDHPDDHLDHNLTDDEVSKVIPESEALPELSQNAAGSELTGLQAQLADALLEEQKGMADLKAALDAVNRR